MAMSSSTPTLNTTFNATSQERVESEVIMQKISQKIGLIFGSFGILGNGLVIVALYQKGLKIHELLIINQSIIDLLCSISMIVHSVWVIGQDIGYNQLAWWLKNLLCRIVKGTSLLWGLFDVSTFNLCIVTVERYLAITSPLFHHVHITKFKAKIAILAAWVGGLLVQIVPAINVNQIIDDKCIIWRQWRSPSGRKLLGTFLFLTEWLLPVTLLVACNAHMAWVIHESRRCSRHRLDIKRLAARNNLFRTMLLVAIGFILCNSWNAFCFFFTNIGSKNVQYARSYYQLTIVAYLANAVINPFVYTLQYTHFRRRLFNLAFKCRKRNEKSNDSSGLIEIGKIVKMKTDPLS